MRKGTNILSILTGSESKPHASSDALNVSQQLEQLAREAVTVAKKAKKARKGLSGDNGYAQKLAVLRSDAANMLRRMQLAIPEESTELEALVEAVFSAKSERDARLAALRELAHSLRTKWQSVQIPTVDDGLFPLSILTATNRGFLVTVGKQMNGCFTAGWYDAAAVMMRRLIEIAIIEAFEGRHIASKIRDANGNYFQLTELVNHAINESALSLSRNAKKALPLLRDVGHMSAHGRYFTAKREDVEAAKQGCRIVVEEFLNHAGLL
jgi:hypothetical protein